MNHSRRNKAEDRKGEGNQGFQICTCSSSTFICLHRKCHNSSTGHQGQGKVQQVLDSRWLSYGKSMPF
eukprot:12924312-Prorocentrum_lima.AAC.1